MIAALYVEPGGAYYGIPDVDPWDAERDARTYAGPWPVVAHPPCARWCQMAGLVEHRYGLRRKEDGGCFESALTSVRRWGGVLEHPAYTLAWAHFNLPVPVRRAWTCEMFGPGWVTEVSQVAYGHRGRKRTWLYFVGECPPLIDWGEPEATAWCRYADSGPSARLGRERYRSVERMGHAERSATPPAFRDLLLEMARSVAKRGRS